MKLANMAVAVLLWASTAVGQTAPFTLTPPAGSPVSYAAGLALTFSVPVTIAQTGNSITITWGTTPTPPTPTPPVPPVSTIPANWKGDLFIIAFFDPSVPQTADTKAVQSSTTIAASLTALAPTVNTKWIATDMKNETYAQWRPPVGQAAATFVAIATNGANENLGNEKIPLPTPESAIVAEVKRIRGIN